MAGSASGARRASATIARFSCPPGRATENAMFGRSNPVEIGNLDEAIISVASGARPSVGRTTCAEILHGSRSKKIQRNSYDGLPAYGVSAHLRRADILARVDQLIDEGRLETTGGPYPVLRVAA